MLIPTVSENGTMARSKKSGKTKSPISIRYLDRAKQLYLEVDGEGDWKYTIGAIWKKVSEELDEHPARESVYRRAKRDDWDALRYGVQTEAYVEAERERSQEKPSTDVFSPDAAMVLNEPAPSVEPVDTIDRLLSNRDFMVQNITRNLRKTDKITMAAMEILEREMQIHGRIMNEEIKLLNEGVDLYDARIKRLRKLRIPPRELVQIAGLGRLVQQNQLNLVINQGDKGSEGDGAIYGWEDDDYPEPAGDEHIARDGDGRIIDVEAMQ